MGLWSNKFGIEQFISNFSYYRKIKQIKQAKRKAFHKQASELGLVLRFQNLMPGWEGEVIVLKLYYVQYCQ